MQVDITNLPVVVADMLGVSELAGGIFAVLILFLVTLVPILYVMKDSSDAFPYIILLDGLLVSGFGIAIGWLGVWFMIILVLGLSALIGKTVSDLAGG